MFSCQGSFFCAQQESRPTRPEQRAASVDLGHGMGRMLGGSPPGAELTERPAVPSRSEPCWPPHNCSLPVCSACGCVFVNVKCGPQILSFCVSCATVYSTPAHSANTSCAPPLRRRSTQIHILSPSSCSARGYCVRRPRTPPPSLLPVSP